MNWFRNRTSLLNRYQQLINISCDLASELDLNILLSKIVHAASEVTDAKEASILMHDSNKGTLYFQAATNLDSQLKRGLHVPLKGSIAGWIVENQRPIIVDNPQVDKRHFDYIGKITNITCESLLGIPLITKSKVIGVLEVINKREGNFTQEDQDILLALGAQAAVAIENSRLFLQTDLIGEFVHEIRTPLSALGAAAHLLKNNRIDEKQKRKMIKILEAEIESLSDMSSSFLDLVRLESGRKQYKVSDFNILDLLIECHEIIISEAQKNKLKLELALPDSLPLIVGDRKQLKQAFLNLLNNAIKFNKEGGEVLLKASSDSDHITITISDTGLGIPKDEQSRIFEKFYRVRTHRDQVQGTGLGLSVVKQIIHGHGGEIDFASQENIGTTFTVILPTNK
jgi:two-component system phosphate regulon sensor histidine kinase PhoR